MYNTPIIINAEMTVFARVGIGKTATKKIAANPIIPVILFFWHYISPYLDILIITKKQKDTK